MNTSGITTEKAEYNQRQFVKQIITKDNLHFFWLLTLGTLFRISEKDWETYGQNIVKSTLSANKVLYAIFFSSDGLAIQVPVKKSKVLPSSGIEKVERSTMRNDAQLQDSSMANIVYPTEFFCN